MNDAQRNFVVVIGIDNESDVSRLRSTLKKEFSKFGQVTKLYTDEKLRFAKIYFDTFEICDSAVKELRRNPFGWTVLHQTDQRIADKITSIRQNFNSKKSNSASSNENNNSFRDNFSSNDQLEMDDYLEEEFSENCDYCNVHGQPLTVFQADSGDFFVNLKDIRKTGFALFRRDTFDSILINKSQIQKEFDLHLLSEAKNYILKNRVNCIDEDKILQTIERCKNRLLNNPTDTLNGQQQIRRSVPNSEVSDYRTDSFDNGGKNKREHNDSRYRHEQPRSRPPNTLADNFMPSNKYSSNINTNQNRRPNDNNRNRDDNRTSFSKSDSNGWDSNNKGGFNKSEFRRPDSNRDNFSKGEPSRNDGNRGSFNKKDFNKGFDNVVSSTPNHSNSAKSFEQMENKPFNRRNDQPRPRNTHQSEVQKEKLENGNTYDVKICYIDPEKDNVVWVQKIESLDLADKMLIDISELEPNAEVISNLTHGQLVLGEFEGVWFRAEVLNTRTNLLHYIDYGNQSNTDAVKQIPDSLKNIPALAIRMAISNKTGDLSEGDDLSVIVKRQYEDNKGTFLVEIIEKQENNAKGGNSSDHEIPVEIHKPVSTPNEKVKDEVEKPSETTISKTETSKAYIVNPVPLNKLKDGDKVMFVERVDKRFALKTKECVDKSKELIAYIRELDKSALVMTNVEEGQLVLCTKEGQTGLCRAIVKEVKQNIATVKYVDYYGEDVLTVKSLRNVDEYLAQQPAALLFSPEIKYLENLNMPAINFITQLVIRKERSVVVMSEKEMDFRLPSEQLLSECLLEISPETNTKSEPQNKQQKQSEPVTKQKTEEASEKPEKTVVQSDEKVLYDDMDWIKLKPGEFDFICYHLKDARDITLVSTLDDHVKYMEEVADLQDQDKIPYKPEVYEMCLVYYVEDTEGFWYRGVVVDVEGNDFVVMMVDFGNETTVQYDKLRKFPKHLKRIPILGLACDFQGVPNTPRVTEILKENIQDNQNFKAVIHSFDEETLKYVIDIPCVRQKLKEESIC